MNSGINMTETDTHEELVWVSALSDRKINDLIEPKTSEEDQVNTEGDGNIIMTIAKTELMARIVEKVDRLRGTHSRKALKPNRDNPSPYRRNSSLHCSAGQWCRIEQS